MTSLPFTDPGKIDEIDPPVPPVAVPNPAADRQHAEMPPDDGGVEGVPAGDSPALHPFA